MKYICDHSQFQLTNSLSEAAMGIPSDFQNDEQSDYLKAVYE